MSLWCSLISVVAVYGILSNGFKLLDAGDYCYATDPDPFRLYATKTTYATVTDRDVNDESIPGCEAVGIWLLARHGTRHTGTDDVADMKAWLPKVRDDIDEADGGRLCAEDVEAIAEWDSPMPDDKHKTLAETGWDEFRGIGSRFKQRYPDLLDIPYDPQLFVFRHTDHESNRTRDTARALAQGLFGTDEGVEFTQSPQPDTLLRFYDFCLRYDKEVGDEPVEEKDKFINGSVMRDTLRAVADRLGQRDDYFDYESLDVLYDNCRVEYGLYGEAAWCASFLRQDLEVLEYVEDIKYYWEDSYAHDINWQMACELTADFMKFMNDRIDLGQGPVLRSLFGHSQTMNGFFTSIGLYRPDEHLTSANWPDQQERAFRASKHTPMGSNIALVLYSCADDKHRVKAVVNEVAIELAGCPVDEYGSCDFDDFTALYQPTADQCDYDALCSPDATTATGCSIATSTTWIVAMLLIREFVTSMSFA